MKRIAVGFGLGAALVLAACTSTHHTLTGSPPTSTSVPATASPSSTSSTSPATSSPTSSSVPASLSNSDPAAPTYCATGQLTASLGSANGAAGTIYYALTLRNISSSTCIEEGYPGVSFVAGAGHQVGAPANRQPGPISTATLAPGDSISATLGITDASNFPTDCNRTPVLGLRVYPPNQTAALFVSHSDYGCTATKYVTLHIYPLGYTP